MARRPLADRLRQHRLAACLPWTDGAGRPWRGWARLPLAAPFVLLYLAASWAFFLLAAERQEAGAYAGKYAIDEARFAPLLFRIPDLGRDPPGALLALVAAPFLNHDHVQIVYVTILLLLFGVPFEAREGPGRAAALFFGTTFAAAIVAGVLLHLIYPAPLDAPLLAVAWERTWSGGSAASFGLMGALAARARVPWPLLGLFALWEINVAVWYLRSYTPAFHLTALVVGFVAMRYLIAPGGVARADRGARGAGRGAPGDRPCPRRAPDER